MTRTGRPSDPTDLIAGGKHVQAGRVLESRNQIDEAIEEYLAGGAWQEAARLLSFQGRFHEAGMALLRSLPDRPTPVIRISPEVRRDAMNAALCFARGGARKEAVGLLVNLGEHQRAAGLLSMAGLRDDAVRAMRGEHIEGSPWPPGILFNPGATQGGRLENESGPQWSDRSAGSKAPARTAGSAPWESERSDRGPAGQATDEQRRPRAPGSPPGARPRVQPRSEPYLSDSLEFRPGGLDDASRAGPAAPERLDAPSRQPASAPPAPPDIPSTSLQGAPPWFAASSAQSPTAPARTPPAPAGAKSPTPPGPRSRLDLPTSSVTGVGTSGSGPSHFLKRGTPGSLAQQELASSLATAPSDRSYPIAVARVIEGVWDSELLAARVTRFLDDYLARAVEAQVPDTAWSTLYAMGRLFEFHDRIDGARLAYRALVHDAPQYADAALRLSNIERGLAEAEGGSWQPIQSLIDGACRFSPLPDFEDMPPLGVAPAGPVKAPPSGRLDRDAAPAARPGPRQDTPDRQPARATSAQPPPGDETLELDDASRPPLSTSSPSGRSRVSGSEEFAGGEMDADGLIATGTEIAGRYRIDAMVGSGGMAHVYRATDLELEEVVAIKVFHQVIQNRAGLDRFRREMKLSRKLVHPNIVRIYEFGTWRGARFITMELLDGDDLGDYLARAGGPLPIGHALRLMIQACDGLGAAHEAGVIHRDVKPQNLFVIEKGTRLKVMDFGIAKVETNAASISVTGVRVGTPRYMSPEQIQGDANVTLSSDLYALGGVMYEVVTGTPVFREEELVPLLLSHMTEEPEPPSRRNPAVPPDVEQIVLRLLRKAPQERYANCVELKKALLQAFVASQRG